MTTQRITEIGVTFYRSGGHKHDGITSSLIDTSKYSMFDFDLSLSTGTGDTTRETRRQTNKNRFDQYVASFVTSQVLAPAGIVLPPNSVGGVNIGANEITANNIAAKTITANEIAANTITSDLLITDFAVVNSTIRSNNFTYDAGNGTGNGWAIYSNGDAIFNSGTFSGKIDVGGLDTSSFHVDTGGNVWSGRGTIGVFGASGNATGAPFQVLASGNVSLAYGAVQAFNNSYVLCNAGLVRFGGGSGTTLVVEGSVSSGLNIVASGNVRADTGQVSSSTGYVTNRLDVASARINLTNNRNGTDVDGVTQVVFRRTNIGTANTSTPSGADDQILQIWNQAPNSTKVNVAGIAFASTADGVNTTATVLRYFSGAVGSIAITGINEATTPDSLITGIGGSGTGLDVGNASGGPGGYGYMGAIAFVTRSSALFKEDIEYMPIESRSISINRIKNLKPARWNDRVGYQEGVLSPKFIDINNRWVARGKSPLTAQLKHNEFKKHICSESDCFKDENGLCENFKFYNKRPGFVAEDVAEIFPKAVQYNGIGHPIGIDYSVITFALVETMQEMLEKIEDLENKINELSS